MDVLMPVIENALAHAEMEGAVQGSDGLLYCPVCGEPRQFRLPSSPELPDLGGALPIPCRCQRERAERDEAEEQRHRAVLEARRAARELGPLYDAAYDRFTFAQDCRPDCDASRLARRYVERFEAAREKGLGLLFTGPVGTGKSFLAACVVNALREEQGRRAVILSTQRLVEVRREAKSFLELLDRLAAFDLVALDDLGAERATDYSLEALESLVDTRALRSLPLLVTTNLNVQELSEPRDLRYQRTFDRLRLLCPRVVVLSGPSLRGAAQKRRAEELDAALLQAAAPP